MSFRLLHPRRYFNEFRQLLTFTIQPKYDTQQDLNLTQKIEGTWTMFVLKFVLAVITGVSIGLFYDPENKTTVSMAERFSPPILFLVSVLVLPLLEEFAFRLSLKFRPIYLTLTLGTLGYYLLSKTIFMTKLSDIHHCFEERILLASALMLVSYPILSISIVRRKLSHFWVNHFSGIFYFFCLTFAWVHILNYELNLQHLLLMPFITLPKLVSALCYGYVRMNYGFIFSFAIHVFNNSIGFAVNILS